MNKKSYKKVVIKEMVGTSNLCRESCFFAPFPLTRVLHLHTHVPKSSFIPAFFLLSGESCLVSMGGWGGLMIDCWVRGRHINQKAWAKLHHNANGLLIDYLMTLNNGPGFSLSSMHDTTMGWQCAFKLWDTSHNAVMHFLFHCFVLQ